MESTALIPANVSPGTYFTSTQLDLIRRQVAPNVSDDEFMLFTYQCARTGLDPLSRQIYALERREKVGNDWVSKMSIQTGIDGLRLIADRTGRYAPGPENTYEYDSGSALRKATAHVRKKTADGTWHVISASAFLSEYAQLKSDGKPTKMWAEKPHIMLGKCAEALALRKAFPAEMSGIYTSEEMGQTDQAPTTTYEPPPPPKEPPPPAQPPVVVDELGLRINKLCKMKAPDGLGWTNVGAKGWLKKRFGVESTNALTEAQKRDAEILLLARMESEDTYDTRVEMMAQEGRVLGDGEVQP